jgi:SOS response regulatory protein OraA/RecX
VVARPDEAQKAATSEVHRVAVVRHGLCGPWTRMRGEEIVVIERLNELGLLDDRRRAEDVVEGSQAGRTRGSSR